MSFYASTIISLLIGVLSSLLASALFQFLAGRESASKFIKSASKFREIITIPIFISIIASFNVISVNTKPGWIDSPPLEDYRNSFYVVGVGNGESEAIAKEVSWKNVLENAFRSLTVAAQFKGQWNTKIKSPCEEKDDSLCVEQLNEYQGQTQTITNPRINVIRVRNGFWDKFNNQYYTLALIEY